jgi:hypothetical protein
MLVTPVADAAAGVGLDAAVVAAFAAVVAVLVPAATLVTACAPVVAGAAAVAAAPVVAVAAAVVTGDAVVGVVGVVGVAVLLDPQAESTSRRLAAPTVARRRIIAEAVPVIDAGEEELVDIEPVNQPNLREYCELSVTFRPQRGGRAAFPSARPRSPTA